MNNKAVLVFAVLTYLRAGKYLMVSQQRRNKTAFDDFLDLVKIQIRKQFSVQELNQNGLRIFTSLDPYVQLKTTQTARHTEQLLGPEYESALVVSHPKSGEVIALSGSKSKHSFYNRAINAKRQIGSLIKPFVFLAGLELLDDFSLNSNLQDRAQKLTTEDGQVWSPKNWDNLSRGRISASQALIQSRNQATVDLGLQIGLKPFIRFLQQLGLHIQRSGHPSIFLGATDLTPMEVENLFFILSSGGSRQQLSAIRSITNSKGETIRRTQPAQMTPINSLHVKAINNALQQVTLTGTAKKISTLYQLPQPLYGKTGTTNQGRDSWFVGFNSQYLATAWVGRDDNKPTPLSGSSGALVLWSHLFKNLQANNASLR